jgi:hypothetical protein
VLLADPPAPSSIGEIAGETTETGVPTMQVLMASRKASSCHALIYSQNNPMMHSGTLPRHMCRLARKRRRPDRECMRGMVVQDCTLWDMCVVSMLSSCPLCVQSMLIPSSAKIVDRETRIVSISERYTYMRHIARQPLRHSLQVPRQIRVQGTPPHLFPGATTS